MMVAWKLRRYRPSKRVQLICLAVITLQVHAVSAVDYPDEQYYFEDLPVVLSATRLSQPVSKTPAAITVIDRQMIEASGAREIHELFRLVPGAQVGSPSGHVHSVTYHGMSDQFARRMQVLVDGRSVYNPAIGGVEWTQLPLVVEDIERIEFIRGPNAVTYGANAFLATINIITRNPYHDSGTSLSLIKGSDGIQDATLRLNAIHDDFSYRMTLGYEEDDGFEQRNDAKNIRRFNLFSDHQLSTRDDLEVQVGFSHAARDVVDEDDPRNLPGQRKISHQFQRLRWNHVFSLDNEFTLQFYHNRDRVDENRKSLIFETVVDDSTVDRLDLEFFNLLRLDQGKRFVWGASTRRDKLRAPVFFNRTSALENRLNRLFGNLEWSVTPKWVLNAGVMWENNDITGSDLSPRLAINYSPTPRHTIRAGISRALRTPVLFEEEADLRLTTLSTVPPPFPADTELRIFTSPGGLDPETILSRELGYVGHLPDAGLTLDIRGFYDTISDLIDVTPQVNPPPLPDTSIWGNQHSVTVTGTEISLDWQPKKSSRFVLNYAYAVGDGDSEDIEDSIPTHTASLMAIQQIIPHLLASATYHYVDDMLWLDDGDFIEAYDRLDLRLAYDYPFDGNKIRFELVAQNLLGRYENFSNDNVADRVIYGGVTLDL